jgi:transforming growth factor-beta-induced protein
MSAKVINTLEKEEVIVRSMNGAIMVNNADVTKADVEATNGFVHIINRVLVPPDFPMTLYSEDIVELAESQPDLSTLVQALVAGKLTTTLSGTGPFTVFAPTNEAFSKIPDADLQKLLANPKELDAVLEYHVLAGDFSMRDLMSVRSATTLEGGKVTVSGSGSVVKVNDATVVKADVRADNGVVHVIDAVLMPPKSLIV